VRSLEREISKLCRKAVKQLLLDKSLKHIEINGDNLHDYLGVQRLTMAVRIAKTASVR
jgi:ATP-dependent Lon protease